MMKDSQRATGSLGFTSKWPLQWYACVCVCESVVCAVSIVVGSGASSSSESDVGCLQSGVCAKQKNVSSRDAYIAKESLELLVSCLQLRSPILGESCTSVFADNLIKL